MKQTPKLIYSLTLMIISVWTMQAQTRHPAASLDMRTADGGILVPHLTTAQRDALATDTDSKGLLIFNTTTQQIETHTGTDWRQVIIGASESNNTAIGQEAFNSNTTGGNNTALGSSAGRDVTTADNNTFLGYNTGRGIVSGDSNTIIGANITGLSSTLTNTIVIADGDGNERIYINAQGEMGINTTDPTALLHISQAIANPQEIVPNLEGFSDPRFGIINATRNSGAPASLFDNDTEAGGASIHVYRVTAGQDWGIRYQFTTDYFFTQVRLQARDDTHCCWQRASGGVVEIYRNGQLIATSGVLNATGGAASWTNSYYPNVVGDEVRYIFKGGANTGDGSNVFNASEFEIKGQTPTDELALLVDGKTKLTGSLQFTNFAAGTLQTDANGNVSISSDERLKNIRGEFTKGLDALLEIQPIQYRWNATSGLEPQGLYTGFSAQNVQQHLPEAVGQDARGYLTLSDRPLLAAMTNALRELHATSRFLIQANDSLSAAVRKLQTDKAALEERLEALEK